LSHASAIGVLVANLALEVDGDANAPESLG